MQRVSVLLTNRFATFLKPYPLEDLQGYFSFRPSGYRFMPAYRNGYWDGYIRLLKRDKVPTGLFLAYYEQIQKELGVSFQIKKQFVAIPFRSVGVTSDRDYQNECVERMVAAAQHHGGGLVLSATGSGKTRIAGMFFRLLKGNACFIVDELTLLQQAQEELSKVVDEEVGNIGEGVFNPKRITVATVQTLHLHREDKRFTPWVASLLVNIIDELHLAMNRRNFEVVEAIAPPAVFGLTATLELQKQDVRTKAFALTGPVCYEYALASGVDQGYLAKGVVVQVIYQGADDSSYGRGQFSNMYRDVIVTDPDRNQVIEDLVRYAVGAGKYTIVLVERLRHLRILSKLLHDIPHRVVAARKELSEGLHEKIPVKDRMVAKRKFEAGDIRLILANKVFQKGIDIKRVDVVIDAGAMKNKNRAIQIFGRGVRLCEGKTGLLHFDIADGANSFRKAAKWRRSAFKAKLIPLQRVDSEKGAQAAFMAGEKLLAKYIARFRTKSEPKQQDQLLLFQDVPHD